MKRSTASFFEDVTEHSLIVLGLPFSFLMGVRYGLILQREKLERLQEDVQRATQAASGAKRATNE